MSRVLRLGYRQTDRLGRAGNPTRFSPAYRHNQLEALALNYLGNRVGRERLLTPPDE